VFDGTHLRWFGLEDALDLLRQSGLEPRTVVPSFWKSGIRHFVKGKNALALTTSALSGRSIPHYGRVSCNNSCPAND
jgi:hypothetical protein